MSTQAETTRQLAQQFVNMLWDVRGNSAAADSILAADYIAHDRTSHSPFPPTRDGEKQMASVFRTVLNLSSEVQEVIVEGEKAAVYWQASGTHQGELLGLAPSGKPVQVQGITLLRVKDEKIAESWAVADRLSLMQQLGLFRRRVKDRSKE